MKPFSYPKMPIVFANLDFIPYELKKKILGLIDFKEGEIFSFKAAEKKKKELSEKLSGVTVSSICPGSKYCIAFLPQTRKIICPKRIKSYPAKALAKPKEYWESIVRNQDEFYLKKKRITLRMDKGYFNYGRKFKQYQEYFSNLSEKEYHFYQKVILEDPAEDHKLWAMLALHHWKNKREILRALSKLIHYPEPWDANNAGFFMLPLSRMIEIPPSIIFTLIHAEHQGPITKGLYLLNANLTPKTCKELRKRKNLQKLKELSQWKTPSIRKYARKIIKKYAML